MGFVWTMCQILCCGGRVSLGRLTRVALYTINQFVAYTVIGLFWWALLGFHIHLEVEREWDTRRRWGTILLFDSK